MNDQPENAPVPQIGEQLAADLRARIARGELKAGDRLATEEELLEVHSGRSGGVFIAHPGMEQLARGFAVRLVLAETSVGDLYETRQ